ncbi:ATP-binding cassette domain-containing protein, partial [Tetragenococcus muriaticus]|uniref:ATP-binding cassette domain-containing protein n=1 Tax=Tetragenococcus muriaticus TaxID=64642 RepID=UPI001E389B6B
MVLKKKRPYWIILICLLKKTDFITVLGGNGAGKSTLFNTVSGSMPLSSGKIF